MAKQDDGKNGKSGIKPPKVTPRLVKEIPEGYKEEIRDGKKVYVKTETTPASSKPAPKPKVTTIKAVSKGAPKRILPPKPIKSPETIKEDVVYLEEPTQTIPAKQPIELYGSVDAYRKVLPKANANQPWEDIIFANESGNFTNNPKIVRTYQGKPIESDVLSQFDAQGNFVPKYTGQSLESATPFRIMQPKDSGVNKQNMSNTSLLMPGTTINKQTGGGGSTVSDVKQVEGLPSQYDLNKYTPEGKEIIPAIKPITPAGYSMPAFNKGGLVQKLSKGGKVKGYQYGGPINPYQQNNYEMYGENPQAISGQGIIQQPGSVEFIPTGNAQNSQGNYSAQTQIVNTPKKVKSQQELQNEANIRQGAVSGISALGNAAAMTTTPMNESDAKENAAFQAVGQAGTVGAAVSGIYGLINKAGTSQRRQAEQYTSKGELKDEKKARTMGIVGGILDPIKAYNYRKDSGNWGDISGKGYTKYLEDKAKKQIEGVKEANRVARISDAVAARNSGESDIRKGNLYNLQDVQFDENGQLIMPQANYKKGGLVGRAMQYCADGGVIKGKGGPKDDKIIAKVKADSFVVPAENAKVAEVIREKILIKAPKSKANLNQKGGEKVKLSNGEHLFTPKEKEKVKEAGIDIDKLAPNSENKDYFQVPKIFGFKHGGELTSSKAKKILHDGTVHGKNLTEKQRKYMGSVVGGNNKYAEGGEVDGIDPEKEKARIKAEEEAIKKSKEKSKKESELRKDIYENELQKQKISYALKKDREGKIKEWEKKYKDSEVKLNALKKAYEDYSNEAPKTNTKVGRMIGSAKSPEEIRNKQKEILADIDKVQNEFNNAKRTYDYVKDDKNYTPEGLSKIEASKGLKATKLPKGVEKKEVVTSPEVSKTTVISPKTGASLSKVSTTGKSDVLPSKNVSLSEIKNLNTEPSTEVTRAENKIFTTPIVEQNVQSNTPSINKRRGLADILGNVDPTAFVGPAQTYLGTKMLRGEKRPEYNPTLDASVNAATDKAIKEAQYGLSPEERMLSEQNIQNSLNDARFSARNFAGGSAGTAFNQERAAINSGLANKLSMQIADQQLRREKQQYANQLAANRAAINAQNKQDVFNIANQAFNQRQQAGAELVGAGLANTVGAYRYNRNAKMMNDVNQQANPWSNYNYNV